MIARLTTILSLVPVEPGSVTVEQILDGLAAKGMATTKRTVQRDLVALSKLFPVVARADSKRYGWSFKTGAQCPCCGVAR